MRFHKSITALVIFITIFSLIAAGYGVYSSQGKESYEFSSIHGNAVEIYGKGIYKNDSVVLVSQGVAQDVVTLVMAIPLLLISLFIYRKGSFKGKLLLTGTVGYFLYTYMSYTFLCMYNSMFLIYVMLMSSSLFAFILLMMSFDMKNIEKHFSPKMPVKFIAGFLFFLAAALGFMWLGLIAQPLLNGTKPEALEHYTTLVIQAMDLGLVVPAAIVTGILVLKRTPMGYLLSSVLIIKGLSMGVAIIAMIIGQLLAGIEISTATIIVFSSISLVIVYCLILIMKNIIEPKNGVRSL